MDYDQKSVRHFYNAILMLVLPNFSKSSFKTDLSTLLDVGQNFKPFERRETSALLSLQLDKFTTFLDTKKPFNLPFDVTSAFL